MPVHSTLNSFWFHGVGTEVTYFNATNNVVSEKTASRLLVARSQYWLSGHPSKYWPRATLLDYGDRQSQASTVQLPVSVFFFIIFFLDFLQYGLHDFLNPWIQPYDHHPILQHFGHGDPAVFFRLHLKIQCTEIIVFFSIDTPDTKEK